MKRFTAVLVLTVVATATANADINGWLSAASSAGAGYTNTGIAAPTQHDIGTFDLGTGGGVTYEFIYNADQGGPSSAFMGSLNAPAGASGGLKLDQWNQTGMFGATAFGVADYTSTTPYVANADTQVVFVADGTNTDLYVNGSYAETMAGASFALSGLTGLGHAYNHGNDGSVDPLNGTILGVAVYDSALSADAISGNFAAFVPEPNSGILLVVGLTGLLSVRRRR